MILSPQEPALDMNYIVLLTCAMCLVTYVVMAVILRKLDQLDISRVRVIPFCGKGGRFKYEILVKTGWGRGSGEGRGPLSWAPRPLSFAVWPPSLKVIIVIDDIKQGFILLNTM